jgi:seryl-tRNA synthetase
LAKKVQRGLRSLLRKIVYRTSNADSPQFLGDGTHPDILMVGDGQAILSGLPERLFRYFDRILQEFGDPWKPKPIVTPTLIPSSILAKCDYFRSFPQNVTFASHIGEDAETITAFRERHKLRDDLEPDALKHMQTPEACLSPAVCYHVYAMNKDRVIAPEGPSYDIRGKCFRFESTNMRDLRRLWDFTMRETVFIGSREHVLAQRDKSVEIASRVLEEVGLAGEIRTASDPFFSASDAMAKTYFQLSSETKYEMAVMLHDGSRLAVGSLNYHTDFFGRVFNIQVEGAGAMHSVCCGFGVERWVYAFLSQHGNDPKRWPSAVLRAPEFANGIS